ncbi:hypothetical protein ACLX1H_005530 [Fusarium chlamydosporum]
MRYTLAVILPAIVGITAYAKQSHSPAKVNELVQIPDWIENVATRPNKNLLLTTIGRARVYSLDPTKTSPSPQVITQIEDVNGLFGITEVGHDVFAVVGGNFTDSTFLNNTMNLSLLDFTGGKSKPTVRTVFKNSEYGPVNGITTLPHSNHIILAADSTRGKILRIDVHTGQVDIAIDDDELAIVPGGPFSAGVNGLKVFHDHLYFTNTASQTLNRVKIDRLGNVIGKYEMVYKFASTFPDDFVVDKHGNAFVACWMDKLVKITPAGKMSVLSQGLLAGPTAVALDQDEKTLYVVTAGQGEGVTG